MECEGLRPDVVAVNLSMMSFLWWDSKKDVYKEVMDFPGTHYSKKDSVGHKKLNGFTFGELLEANYDKFPGGIYLGGKLNFQEQEHKAGEAERGAKAASCLMLLHTIS